MPQRLSDNTKEAVLDRYQSSSTHILLCWVLSNAVIIATILDGDYSRLFSAGIDSTRLKICTLTVSFSRDARG